MNNPHPLSRFWEKIRWLAVYIPLQDYPGINPGVISQGTTLKIPELYLGTYIFT